MILSPIGSRGRRRGSPGREKIRRHGRRGKGEIPIQYFLVRCPFSFGCWLYVHSFTLSYMWAPLCVDHVDISDKLRHVSDDKLLLDLERQRGPHVRQCEGMHIKPTAEGERASDQTILNWDFPFPSSSVATNLLMSRQSSSAATGTYR
jgi:hypothetical protein